ncbi:MAG TPA: hypothetical protein VNP94_10785 [Actinomycetota bacterium]|nr:hypothetical protein [Actinomycetota bacterium]
MSRPSYRFALGAAAPPAIPQPPPPVPGEGAPEGPRGGPTARQRAEEVLEAAGIDVSHPVIRMMLDASPEEVLAGASDDAFLARLRAVAPSTPLTAYEDALEASGFGARPPIEAGVTTPSELRGVPPERVLTPGESYTVHPETGWVMYRNGVLYDPATGSVVFEPNSAAPGSPYPAWTEKVFSWPEEKVREWKQRLRDFGYLTAEEAKGTEVDQAFLDGLRAYHIARYANFGRAIPLDASAAAGGGAPSLTARDLQAQIRGAVREQFRRVFGNDPSDAELEEWTRFVTRTSLQVQRRLMRRGVSEDRALSVATAEAEERFVERLETSPEATFLRESVEENTRLRDALAAAAAVGRSLGG